MESFIRVNQEVARAIPSCKTDMWKARGFRDIVDEYFQNSLCSLDFLSALFRCHRQTCDMMSLILLAIRQFDEEELEFNSDVVDDGCVGKNYVRTLEILTELAKKTKGIEACRNVLNAIFSATTTTVQICSGAVATVAAPPVARVVEAGAASVMGLMKGHGSTDSNRGQGGPTKTMKFGLHLAICNLDDLGALVNALEIMIEKVEQTVNFMTDVSMKLGIEEMKKMYLSFGRRVDHLGMRADAPRFVAQGLCLSRWSV